MRYISQEMRAPMNTVFMGLDVMEKELNDGEIGHVASIASVKEIKMAANSALTILNDILILDKVKEGLLVLELTDEDPCALVTRIAEEFMIHVSTNRSVSHPRSKLLTSSSLVGAKGRGIAGGKN